MEKMTNVDQLILEFQIEADQYMMNAKYLPYMEDGNSSGFIDKVGKIFSNIINMIKSAIDKIVDIFTNAEAKKAVKNLNDSKALAKSNMMIDYEEYPYEDIRVLQNKVIDKIMAARSEQEVENILAKYKEAKETIIKKKKRVKKIAIAAAAAASLLVLKNILRDNNLHKDMKTCEKFRNDVIDKLNEEINKINKKEADSKAEIDKKSDEAKAQKLSGPKTLLYNFGKIIPIYREACTNALEQSKQASKIISQCESERKRIESEADAERKPFENKIRTTNNFADTTIKGLKDKKKKEKAKRAFSAAVLKADDAVKKTNSFLSDPFAGAREIINKREKEENEIRAEEARKAKEEAKKNKNKK